MYIYQTPSDEQDATQGHFFKRSFSSRTLDAIPKIKSTVDPTIYPELEEEKLHSYLSKKY